MEPTTLGLGFHPSSVDCGGKKGVLGRSLASDEVVISIAEDHHSAETDNLFSNSDDHTEDA